MASTTCYIDLSPLSVIRLTGRLTDTSNLLTEAEKQVKKKLDNDFCIFKFLQLYGVILNLGEGSDTEQGGVGEVHQGAGADQQGCLRPQNRRPC